MQRSKLFSKLDKFNKLLDKFLPKILFFFNLLILFLAAILLLIISITRKNYFKIHIENFPPQTAIAVLTAFIFLLLSYWLFIFNRPRIKFKTTLFILLLFGSIFYIIPPFASRDTSFYSIIARNLLEFKINPYSQPVGNSINPWVNQTGYIWGFDYPSLYGPVFLLISLPAVIIQGISLVNSIYIYKILVVTGYIGHIYFLAKLLPQNKKISAIIFFGLNPSILFHYLTEGHNDVFISLAVLLLIYYYRQKDISREFSAFLISFFIKFNTLFLLPAFWFKNKKIAFKLVINSLIITVFFFMAFLFVFQWNISDFYQNVAFVNYNCLYQCSPVIYLMNKFFGPSSILLRMTIFTVIEIYLIFKFMLKEHLEKYIFWSYILFIFTLVSWLTPWYLLIVIPVGLLINDKKYLLGIYLITVYSFVHYIWL